MKVLISLTLLIATSSFAAGNGTKIYFGNGMFNSSDEVQYSLDQLKRLNISQIETSTSRIEYDKALNLNETSLDNIFTVMEQKGITDTSYFWDVFSGIVPMPDWLSDAVTSAILSPLDSDTEDAMISSYKTAIAAKKKIILVSHSQGNFYAESIFKKMFRVGNYLPQNFGNVRVATPTLTTLDFPYFTFKDDYYMNLVRLSAGAPAANLSSNGSGPGPMRDPRGHNFVLAYLNTPESAEAIRKAIIDQANKTLYPN